MALAVRVTPLQLGLRDEGAASANHEQDQSVRATGFVSLLADWLKQGDSSTHGLNRDGVVRAR